MSSSPTGGGALKSRRRTLNNGHSDFVAVAALKALKLSPRNRCFFVLSEETLELKYYFYIPLPRTFLASFVRLIANKFYNVFLHFSQAEFDH